MKDEAIQVDEQFIEAYTDCVLARNEIVRISNCVGSITIPISLNDLTKRVQDRMKFLNEWAKSHGVAEGYQYNPVDRMFSKVKPTVKVTETADLKTSIRPN